jgi:cytochrome b561
MDKACNRPGLSGYLQTTERRTLQLRPIQSLREPNEVDPANAPARLAAVNAFVIKALHWSSVTLCLGAFLVAWAIGSAADAEAAGLVMLHRSFSVIILALIALRLAWGRCARVRPWPSKTSGPPRLVDRVSVVTLYVLLAVQPLMSLMSSMLYGSRIVVFGASNLPSFVAENEPLARQILAVHGWVALLLLAVIGVHVAVALHDRFLRRDEAAAGPRTARRRNTSESFKSPR